MNESHHRPRLVYAHYGISTFDQILLGLFASEFETYLATFGTPIRDYVGSRSVPEGTRIVQLRDFGKPVGNYTMDNLRIALGTPWRISELQRCLDSIKPDIVAASYATTYGFYASACRWRPFVLFVWGSDILVDPKRSPYHRYMVTQAIRSADLIVIEGETTNKALSSLGFPQERIVSFPWVDLETFRHVMPDSSLRKRLGWQDKTIVVSVRWHEPIYAVDTLIRAIPQIASQDPHIRFLIFGYGTQTAQLMKLAHKLKINSVSPFCRSSA